MVNTSLHQFRIEEKKCLWIPRAHFPISIAIKGIGISCSTGFQQPFWKLIGFDPVSSGEEMTGGGRGGEFGEVGPPTDKSRVRVTSSAQTQVLVTSPACWWRWIIFISRGRAQVVLNHNTLLLPPHPWAIINLSDHHLALKQPAEKQAKNDQWLSCGMSTIK